MATFAASDRPDSADTRVEVVVVDADVVLGDACDVLASGRRSQLLRAIDAGTAKVVMSERAFHEIGWVSAKSARGRAVDPGRLRALVEEDYLPRIPVVATTPLEQGQWMPPVTEVRDVDDIPHVQVARMVSARVVYSHDRHMRIPGFAPRTRLDFDLRIQQLDDVTSGREVELGVGVALGATGLGTRFAVSKLSSGLGLRPPFVWLVIAGGATLGAARVLRSGERRQRLSAVMGPWAGHLSGVWERAASAGRELGASAFAVAPEHGRLEVKVATHLVRNPESTATEIAAGLGLSPAEKTRLLPLLRSHPVFERNGRARWSVGRTREALATWPT